MVGLDRQGSPLGPALTDDDACSDADLLVRIADAAPQDSATRGTTSRLAHAVLLARAGGAQVAHQADLIAKRFSDHRVADANNALKTSCDPERAIWPDWMGAPRLRTNRTVGGSAANPVWERIRLRHLDMRRADVASDAAATGAVLPARAGAA